MVEQRPREQTSTYVASEVVGVFPDTEALQAAVDALLRAGFDRAAISVLATDAAARERLRRLYGTTAAAADDPHAPHAPPVTSESRNEITAAAVGIPFYIASVAGAAAVVASGGVLAAAIAAAVASGAAGAGIGAALSGVFAKQHGDAVGEQISRGGLLLWVGVRDAAMEDRALAVLRQANGAQVHAHTVAREWGAADKPLGTAQPDPLLENPGPSARG
jgi:hypothetical protein